MNVYKITNLVNNKIYIGQDSKDRNDYMGSGKLIIIAINKYGLSSFKKEILDNVNNLDELNEREIYWINFYNSTNKNIGYNISLGGQNSILLNEEFLDKRNKSISISKKGKLLSEKHKDNIKKGCAYLRKNITNTGIRLGEKNGFFNKKHTGDMSRFSTRSNITPTNAKSIIDQNGKKYSSINEASLSFKNPNSARIYISKVCKGLITDYKGFIFKFNNS